MGSILKIYNRLIKTHPLATQSIQTGILMGVGDCIAQTVIEKKSMKEYNFVRAVQFFSVGTGFVGPLLTYWFRFLNTTYKGEGKAVVFKKVATDQLVFAPIFLCTLLTLLGTIQGKSMEENIEGLKRNYVDVMLTNWKMWPAVQLLNFGVVPPQYQVFFVQCVAIIFNTYISWKTQQDVNSPK